MEGCGNESDIESEGSGGGDRQQQQRTTMRKKDVAIVTVIDGTPCPVVSPLQMAHAEHECSK